MAIFAPKLEGQIQAEAPVQAPQTTSPFATALRGVKDITATLGRAAPRPASEASRESSLIQGFGTELSNLLDLQEGGEVDIKLSNIVSNLDEYLFVKKYTPTIQSGKLR